jgi:CelD/BcsL family acetyltransferase involved in cellulose biosynthesis
MTGAAQLLPLVSSARVRLADLPDTMSLLVDSFGTTPSAPAKPAPMENLHCEVVTAFEPLADFQPAWDEAVLRLGGPIYMTYDWLRTWWKHYGAGGELRLLIFRQGGQVVALLPLFLQTIDFGLAKLRVARLVGSNLPPKTFNPPVAGAWALEVFERLLDLVLERERCDLLSLGPVSAEWPGNSIFREACLRRQEIVGCFEQVAYDVQTIFRLPATFDEYLQILSPGERKSRLKRLRQLQNNHQLTTDVVADPEKVGDEFQAFLDQHASQWQAIGKGGHFEAWPGAEAYNRDLVKTQARHGRVRFFRMSVDGEVVANRYTFLLGETLFSELPARAVGSKWDKLGIGVSSMIKFNEDAIRSGVSIIDSGLGEYDHKANLGGEAILVGIWRVVRRHPISLLRARAFHQVARGVKFVFQKVWHRRLVPRLPKRIGRTHSLTWLRFDA